MEQLAAFMPTYHAGDFNRSGAVDAADYVYWRKTMGQTVNMGTAADGNVNGTIDSDDVRVWEANFGKTYSSGAGSGGGLSGSGAAVPEPDARSLIAMAASILIVAARRPKAQLLAGY
jgi:hypothetical protein